jgi:hypothetical protein
MSNVKHFGAKGDGKTDDAEAILHALKDGDGVLEFPPGDYVVGKTIRVELPGGKRFGVVGSAGTAKIQATGKGPVFHLIGAHDKTADPKGFKPGVWLHERMPTAMNIEIEGRNAEADGFLLEGTMQSTFQGVLLRRLRHGICITKRARNVLINGVHIYDCDGVGVFLGRVNLHQINVTGSHISYCKKGGIGVVASEIRNFQIVGNDIEYNYEPGVPGAADIWIDATADGSSVREGTIVGNTIQAKISPAGANIRMIGLNAKENHKAGMFTISNNLIGSQETNVHLASCRGVVLSGNVIYSAAKNTIHVEGSRNIVIGPHSIDHNPDYKEKELCTGVRIEKSRDVSLTGLMIHACMGGKHTAADVPLVPREGLLELVDCDRINLNGCSLLEGAPVGLFVDRSRNVLVTGCTILDSRHPPLATHAVRWLGEGAGNALHACRLGRGAQDFVHFDPQARVDQQANRPDDA